MKEWTSITVDVEEKEVLAFGDTDSFDNVSSENIVLKEFPPLTFMQIVFESDDMDFES